MTLEHLMIVERVMNSICHVFLCVFIIMTTIAAAKLDWNNRDQRTGAILCAVYAIVGLILITLSPP